MIRISGGKFRGRFIHCPSGGSVRPATNQVRQALFNHLSTLVENAAILDVFAGCGSLGIEAISRGAAFCVFVEKNFTMCEAIKRNIKDLKIEMMAVVRKCDAFQFEHYSKAGDKYMVIFIDPPFPYFERQLENVRSLSSRLGTMLKPEGRIVLRTPSRLKMFSADGPGSLEGLALVRVLESGDSHINIFRQSSTNETFMFVDT